MSHDQPKGGCPGCNCGNGSSPARAARRGFMFKCGAGLMAIGGALAAIPVVGFVLGPAKRKYANQWTSLGSVSSFPAGQTRFATFMNPIKQPTDGESIKTACWVRCISDGKYQVFAINCAHLGCPVRWFEQSKLFLCPCHGGVYYEDGSHAAGPPPRGLFEYAWKVDEGNLMIDAGRLPGLEEST